MGTRSLTTFIETYKDDKGKKKKSDMMVTPKDTDKN
jgi:hypothetical protein